MGIFTCSEALSRSTDRTGLVTEIGSVAAGSEALNCEKPSLASATCVDWT